MSVFDDFAAFEFEGDDEESDPKSRSDARERRRKYFEEELKRHREEKRRRLTSDDRGGDDRSGDETERQERQFLHPDILEELVDYCIEQEKFEEAYDFVLLLTERAPFNGDGWHRR